MLPPREAWTAATYARDDVQDAACFNSIADPCLPQRTFACLMRIEDLLLAATDPLRAMQSGEVIATEAAPIVLAPESIEALAAAIVAARAKPGPKPKVEE